MSNVSVERGTFPVSRGYQPSVSVSGPADWAPTGAPPPEEGGGEIYDPTPVTHPPVDLSAPIGPYPVSRGADPVPADMLRTLNQYVDFAAFLPSGEQVGQFMGHPILLTAEEAAAIRRVLASAVARQLDEERDRVLQSVPEAGARAGGEALPSVSGLQGSEQSSTEGAPSS